MEWERSEGMREVKKEEAGSWGKDILCWEAWNGADGMAWACLVMAWTKGSSGGGDATTNHDWHDRGSRPLVRDDRTPVEG
jgi:hypothetical protein